MFSEKTAKQLANIKTHLLLKDIISDLNIINPTTCPFCHRTGKWKIRGRGEIGTCYSSKCKIRTLNKQGVCDVISAYRLVKSNNGNPLGFYDAIEELSKIIEDKLGLGILSTQLLDERHKIISQVWNTFSKELGSKHGIPGMKYLIGRGFKEVVVRELGIGYASINTLRRNPNLCWEDLCQHKLIDNSSGREFFWDSVIFPVRDTFCRFLHLQGRSICSDIPKDEHGDERWPRYKATSNISGIPNIDMYMFLEHKLGIYKDSSNIVFVCEGVPDVISLYQSGGSVVGIFGTHGLLRNMYKLQGIKEIVIIADNDKYDITHPYYSNLYKSWERLIPQLISLQLVCPHSHVYIFMPPPEIFNKPTKDINDMFRVGIQGDYLIEYILKHKVSLSKFLIDNKFHDPDFHLDILKIIGITGICKDELESLILEKYDNFMNYLLNVITA